jgi:hypothetical protein
MGLWIDHLLKDGRLSSEFKVADMARALDLSEKAGKFLHAHLKGQIHANHDDYFEVVCRGPAWRSFTDRLPKAEPC